MSKKTIITTAIPYVNNTPHLGNLIGSLLSADVYTRYRKRIASADEEIVFVGGVDEYGTATEVKARELGVSCKELCDKNEALHREVYDWFLLNFDCYGRTSQPNGDPSIVQLDWPQTRITQDIFKALCEDGYVIEQTEKVMYCPAINSFVADRFVIGTCPKCGSTKANGDQCDECGQLFEAGEVLNPRYKPNPEFGLELRQTTNLYIDTGKIWNEKDMTEWFTTKSRSWTKTATSITAEWLKSGLLPRSITRDLVWGTSVPDTDEFGSKYAKKVFYVWFDAPIGYISITETSLGREKSESLWRDPNTKLVQFMAKDNVPFHTIIFPVTLRGSGYSEMTDIDIVSTEYLMYEGEKFSKTRNIGLFCDDVMKISKRLNIPPDYWRAYLISIRPENADSNFVLNGDGGFVDFVNNILLKNFGNLVHRVLSVAYQIGAKHGVDKISSPISSSAIDNTMFFRDLDKVLDEYNSNMKSYKLSDALRTTLKYSTEINRSFTAFAPWTLTNKPETKDEQYAFMCEVYKHISVLLNMFEPFMPSVVDRIRQQLTFDTVDKNTVITPLKDKPTVVINPLEKIHIDERR